jgi:hypothetical protein
MTLLHLEQYRKKGDRHQELFSKATAILSLSVLGILIFAASPGDL